MSLRQVSLTTWVNRPRLAAAIVLGLATAAAAAFWAHVRTSTASIAGWDAFCLTFMGLMAPALFRFSPDQIRARATREDEGRGLILFLTLVAAVASLGAVVAELSLAKSGDGGERLARVAAAFATVAISWMTVQVIFALHYAHAYYTAGPKAGSDTGGLAFPGKQDPDYQDFLHFSIVIGVACQTADIAFTAKALRRIGTVHSLVAFAYNTVVVALTLNLLAGLF